MVPEAVGPASRYLPEACHLVAIRRVEAVSGDRAVLTFGSLAGVLVVSAAEFLATLGET